MIPIKEEFGDFGSRYPSDPVTKLFLKKNGSRLKDSKISRKSWATWKEIFPEKAKNPWGFLVNTSHFMISMKSHLK